MPSLDSRYRHSLQVNAHPSTSSRGGEESALGGRSPFTTAAQHGQEGRQGTGEPTQCAGRPRTFPGRLGADALRGEQVEVTGKEAFGWGVGSNLSQVWVPGLILRHLSTSPGRVSKQGPFPYPDEQQLGGLQGSPGR